MAQAREVAAAATEVLLDVRRGGTYAVFIVEVRNRQEMRELKEMFAGLAEEVEVCPLAEGTIMAYAVRVPGHDRPLLEEIEWTLKENYRFSISEEGWQPTTYKVLQEVCDASESRLHPVPTCGICHSPDPFPTRIDFLAEDGHRLAGGTYCAHCVAERDTKDDRELIARLLSADRSGLAPLGRLRLSETESRPGAGMGYRVATGEARRAAVG